MIGARRLFNRPTGRALSCQPGLGCAILPHCLDLHGARKGGTGRAFGAQHLLTGVSALAASVVFGLAWDRFGSVAAFVGSGAIALAAAASLLVLVPRR